MRALLASPARRGGQFRASDHLHALCGQRRRTGRISATHMNEEKPVLGQSGITWSWVSALVVLLDQITKLWIVEHVPHGGQIHVLPVFDITHTYNPGMAFSWMANWGGAQRWFLSVVAIGVSILLLYWLRSLK